MKTTNNPATLKREFKNTCGIAGPAVISEYYFFMELIFNIFNTFRVNVNKPDHAINSACSFFFADLS